MQKLFIKNRKGQKMAVLLEEGPGGAPSAFVMHGLSGNKESPHIQTFAEAFLQNGFTVVRFDTRNTYGESEGNPEDETITEDFADLEDVISWASGQPWYREPFWLAGHSLGGICTALYAKKYPEKVAGLAPISTVVSWQLSAETKGYAPERLTEWKRAGVRIEPSATRLGLMKRLKWSFVEDRMKYDLSPEVKKLTMPVLLIVGELDDGTPPKHQQLLFDALPGPKEMHIIKGAKHTFIKPKHLAEIKTLFDRWIRKYKSNPS